MDGRRRGRPRKSWKDNIKELTGQSISSLLRIVDDNMYLYLSSWSDRRGGAWQAEMFWKERVTAISKCGTEVIFFAINNLAFRTTPPIDGLSCC